MLILSALEEEKILVGDNIVITVLRTTSGQVKLGFDAPREIEIDREVVRESKNRTRYPDHDSHAPDAETRPC